MTARAVCQLAVLQLQQEDSIYWQLFEYYPDSKIGKYIKHFIIQYIYTIYLGIEQVNSLRIEYHY